MSLIYRPLQSIPPDFECSFCLEILNPGDTVAHAGDGHKHPFHRECAKLAAMTSDKCPFCRCTIDPSSLSTWQDRYCFCLKFMKKNEIINAIAKYILLGN